VAVNVACITNLALPRTFVVTYAWLCTEINIVLERIREKSTPKSYFSGAHKYKVRSLTTSGFKLMPKFGAVQYSYLSSALELESRTTN
jgi:hypothetical protein